ncbi:endonuclease/exonuclease/phosphatase [Penicillium sp. IBT 35674x]|nr:endonuclease/exonuclease/phosphatase [Penicillium sp. IBT 35674x]
MPVPVSYFFWGAGRSYLKGSTKVGGKRWFWIFKVLWMETGYLHRIGNAESDVCDLTFLAPFYTVDTRWNEQRRALTEATDPGLGSLSQMLGGKSESVGDVSEPDGRAWKPNIKIVRAAIAFAIKIDRLAPE